MTNIEEIRAKKLEELQAQAVNERVDQLKKGALLQVLTKEARERLGRIKLVNPQLVEYIESELLQAAQTGQLQQITDNDLKTILARMQGEKKEFKFIRK